MTASMERQALEALRQLVDQCERGRMSIINFNVTSNDNGRESIRTMQGTVAMVQVAPPTLDFEIQARDMDQRVIPSQDEGCAVEDQIDIVTVEDTSGRRVKLSARPYKDLLARLSNHMTCVRAQDLEVRAIRTSPTVWRQISRDLPMSMQQASPLEFAGAEVVIDPKGMAQAFGLDRTTYADERVADIRRAAEAAVVAKPKPPPKPPSPKPKPQAPKPRSRDLIFE